MRIWKYTLEVTDAQRLKMPRSAKLLCVQIQAGVPTLWALVDPSAGMDWRYLLTIGTGNPMPGGIGEYIGTYQLHGGALVFHIFEGLEPAE